MGHDTIEILARYWLAYKRRGGRHVLCSFGTLPYLNFKYQRLGVTFHGTMTGVPAPLKLAVYACYN
jgi:hypothetical protein